MQTNLKTTRSLRVVAGESIDIHNAERSLVHYTDDTTAAHDQKFHQTANG